MINVALFTSYGFITDNKLIRDILNDKSMSVVEKRMKIAELVENNSVTTEDIGCNSMNDLKNYFSKNENEFLISDYDDMFLVYDSELECFKTITVVEVDEKRPWTIDEYDGAESVKYIDNYVLIDEKYNLYVERC